MNKFDLYYEALMEYNKVHKLTGFNTRDEVQKMLFDDSILSFDGFDLKDKKILDVGAGAGFPSVPLLINDSSIDLTIVEALQKRVKFLNILKEKLEIDFKIYGERIEDLPELKSTFDIVTARAVAKLNILLELTVPFLKQNGLAIFIKGPKATEEIKEAINAAKTLNVELVEHKIVKNQDRENHIVVYKKIGKTDKIYPRNFSQIKKKEL